MECLQREGVDTIFGYPGGAVIPVYDALSKSRMRHILVRHEQGAAHAADGYARASGKVGVCLATSGPGSTNLVTGIVSAYMDSVPMVAITGQVAVQGLGSDCFQEADTTGITIPVTKHNYLVKEASDLPRIVHEAFHIAGTGRPGPVLIDIPKDVSSSVVEGRFTKKLDLPGYKPNYEGHPEQVKRVAALINSAEEPVLLAGGGTVRSSAFGELLDLAERASIPVVVTLMGISAFPGDHPLYLGMVGMHGTYAANRAIMASDLIIALGTRFAERSTGNTTAYAPGATIIHIDVDPAEIGKNIRTDTPVVGDVRLILKALLPLVNIAKRERWLAETLAWKERTTRALPDGAAGLDPVMILKEVYRTAGKDAIVTSDVGQHQMWAAQLWSSGRSGSFMTSGGLGAMGYGFPAAIGAKAACPERQVIAIAGDGGFQMNMQELSTARANDLGVKVVILNNGYLGMVRQIQEFDCDRRYFGVKLEATPDFLKIAEAYGVPGYRVETEDQVEPTLRRFMAHEDPAIVEFAISPEANVFPVVSPGDSLDRMIGV